MRWLFVVILLFGIFLTVIGFVLIFQRPPMRVQYTTTITESFRCAGSCLIGIEPVMGLDQVPVPEGTWTTGDTLVVFYNPNNNTLDTTAPKMWRKWGFIVLIVGVFFILAVTESLTKIPVSTFLVPKLGGMAMAL